MRTGMVQTWAFDVCVRGASCLSVGLAVLGGCTSPAEDGDATVSVQPPPLEPSPSDAPAAGSPGMTSTPSPSSTVMPTVMPTVSPPGTESSTPAPPTQAPDEDVLLINPSLHNTVLGRPTDTSIAVSVLADAPGDQVYLEYSLTLSANQQALAEPISTTQAVTSAAGEPMVLELRDLTAHTKVYYRVMYRSGASGFVPDTLHSFRTQRAPGSVFSFGVQGDTHPERYNNKMYSDALMALTMAEVRNRQPDFYFMLGDDFSIEKIVQDFQEANYGPEYAFQKSVEGALPYEEYLATIAYPFERAMIVEGENAPQGNAAYRYLRENFLGMLANASALFLVNGNHEQAHAANLGGIFNNAAVWAADARLRYYPLPSVNAFYSGDADPLVSQNGYPTLEAPDTLLRDYYAFTWGDALFVTIDPYWHSERVSPDSSLYNGDKVGKWDATMGDTQYFWLKDTLERSTARWKFVFAHHINGDGRGGASSIPVQEWGGKLSEFITYRPTWPKPIHQLLVDTGVTVFFQGHDHLFSRETVDGVVYQAVPNPADNSYFAYNCTAYAPASIPWQGPAGYGVYSPDESVILPNTGFLHVTVSPESVRIDYIRTYREEDLAANANGSFTGAEVSGETAFSYSIPPQPGDDQAEDFVYTCRGDAPPEGWIYLP